MEVIDYEDYCWYLLKHDGKLFLDGNYNHSAFGYDFMIQLNETEEQVFKEKGRDYIHGLYHEIQYSAPILKDSKSEFKNRKVPKEFAVLAGKACEVWNKKHGKHG
ncbi:MAG: hypothetical protein JW774_04360 [Candidatus Aureabacteria bacterium]|nr:hypothetical protein [Candidatus Auribacterota bacterium]